MGHARRQLVAGSLSLLLGGCYTGSARSVSPLEVMRDPGWLLVQVPYAEQREENDCGAAALAMVLRYWGETVTREQITAAHPTLRERTRGLRAGELRDFSRARGLDAFVVKGQLDDVRSELERGRPMIVGLGKPHGRTHYAHFEVVVGLHRDRQRVLTLDPARGWRVNTIAGFQAEWAPARNLLLVVFRRTAETVTDQTSSARAPAPRAATRLPEFHAASRREVPLRTVPGSQHRRRPTTSKRLPRRSSRRAVSARSEAQAPGASTKAMSFINKRIATAQRPAPLADEYRLH
jgi:hypothetical protein